MKLACASGAFHRQFERGDLTQLEFLDLCARDIACDGVVLDARHFPRTDSDYLAQVKKMATDLGLDVVAFSDETFFGGDETAMRAALARALEVGAPILAAPLGGERERSWSDQLALINAATGLAKAVNVTIAVRNAPGTFAASVHDCKRVSKEADSAWLRFGPDAQAFDASGDPADLAARTVFLWSVAGEQTEVSTDAVFKAFPDFRGYVAIDEPSGTMTPADATSATRTWRIALATKLLNHT
jgi:sugar phosphate isomerase/epimerase